MENKEIDLKEMLTTLWERKLFLAKMAAIGLIVGVIISFSQPNTYGSTVRIIIENDKPNAIASKMTGIAALLGVSVIDISSYQLSDKLYPEIICSTPFLAEFSDIPVSSGGVRSTLSRYLSSGQKKSWWGYIGDVVGSMLGSDTQQTGQYDRTPPGVAGMSIPQRNFINKLRGSIEVSLEQATGIIVLKVEMQDPVIAANIADSVAVKIKRYIYKYRLEKASENLTANEDLLRSVQQIYFDTERKIYYGYSDTLDMVTRMAQLKLDRLENQKIMDFVLDARLISQIEYNRIKSQQEHSLVTMIEPATVNFDPTSPKRFIIMVTYTFLGLLAAVLFLVIKDLFFGGVDREAESSLTTNRSN